jgi:hypothetical protein
LFTTFACVRLVQPQLTNGFHGDGYASEARSTPLAKFAYKDVAASAS